MFWWFLTLWIPSQKMVHVAPRCTSLEQVLQSTTMGGQQYRKRGDFDSHLLHTKPLAID